MRTPPVSTIQYPVSSIQFQVSDTGPGIAPEEIDSLFEAFAQTETGRQTQEGTGLGLSISQRFVQLMGGDITVSSVVGQGSTFRFTIQAEILIDAEVAREQPARRVLALAPDQPPYRLLVVDDKRDNRRLLTALLRPFGFDLREAANGQEALAIWQQWQPHLIWMDLRMPVMDGYEAAQAIRQLATGNWKLETDDSQCLVSSVQCRTIIIALSASSMAEELSVALSKGCDDFLRKPFREHEIFDLLHKHLGVQFVYEEGEGQKVKGKGQKAEDVLTPEILAALPDDALAEFRSAVEVVDLDRARCIIDRIRQQNAPLADVLDELVKGYRFDTLQALFERIE